MSNKIYGYPVSTERSKRVRNRSLAIERRRKINDNEAKRLNRRAIANGAASSGCLMTITAVIATTFVVLAALVALSRKVTSR